MLSGGRFQGPMELGLSQETANTLEWDISTLPGQIQSEPEAAVALLQALRNTAISVFYQDTDLRFVWARNIPEGWLDGDISGASDRELLSSPTAERLIAAKQAAMAARAPGRLEIRVAGDAGVQWFDIWIDPDLDAEGNVRGLITTAVETTDLKRREETLRGLLREVSHRSRNLLAIIQSIATQTGRFSTTVDQFLSRFRGRVQSLAASQDLVTSSNWRGASLGELVAGQVARYSLIPSSAVRFSGPSPWLNPNAALHVGLALHELAVNSVSFGALSKPYGFINVTSSLVDGLSGKPSLSLVWKEMIGAPDDAAPDDQIRERRFGSVALEKITPASLNGVAELEIAGDQLTYTLIIPFGNFEAE